MPRKLFTSRCHAAIGSEAHVAAYKRPPLYKSVTESHPRVTESTQCHPHHTNKIQHSLSNSVGSNPQFQRKASRTFKLKPFSSIEIQHRIDEIRHSSQRFKVNLHHRTSFSLQCKVRTHR